MGLTKQDYKLVEDEIRENNRINLVVFSVLVSAAMAAMIVSTIFVTGLVENRRYYLMVLITMLIVLALSSKPAKRIKSLTVVGIYLFMGSLYAMGIFMGTVVSPDDLTTSFLVVLFAVPLVFTDIPLRMSIANVAAIIIYCVMAASSQTRERFVSNLTNIIPYGLVSVVVSDYMMQVKALRFSYEQKNKYLSECDQLTGLLNRHSYEDRIRRLYKDNAYLKICAFDVNGLKTVNDTLGHRAGDELLRGAADCIEAVFGNYGKCYRIGGDEYMAILENTAPTPEELKNMLNNRTRCWKGSLVSGLSISIGIAESGDGREIDELIHLADQRMYANKAEYYEKNGIDRRRS